MHAHHVLSIAMIGGNQPAPAHCLYLIQELLPQSRARSEGSQVLTQAKQDVAATQRSSSRVGTRSQHLHTLVNSGACDDGRLQVARVPHHVCAHTGRRALRGAWLAAKAGSCELRAPGLGKLRRTWPPLYFPERSAALPRSVISRDFISGFSLKGMFLSEGTWCPCTSCKVNPLHWCQGGCRKQA